jgi:hypothetical protein
MASTIASVEDVKRAGNISDRVETGVLEFYLNLTSMLFSEMIGSTVYAAALARTLDSSVMQKFRYSEALMAVGLALPALAMGPEERGILSVMSHGAGGQLEKFSFVKEVQELAATFLNLAQQVSSGYITEEGYEAVWHTVVMRMFPSLDEMPTMALIGSQEELLLKAARGDDGYEIYQPEDL